MCLFNTNAPPTTVASLWLRRPQEGLQVLQYHAVVLDGFLQLLGRLHSRHSMALHGTAQLSMASRCCSMRLLAHFRRARFHFMQPPRH